MTISVLLLIVHGIAMGQNVDFSYSLLNNNLCSPSPIKFNAFSSVNPKGYLWDFGNGNRSNNPNPTITYANPGTYNIKLIVVFDQTTREITKYITITPGVTLTLNTSRTQFCTTDTLNFEASSPNTNLQYNWTFGDNSAGIAGNANTASHYFSQFGEYNVSVKATAPNGCQTIATKTIRITPPELYGSFNISSGCIPVNNNFRTRATLPPGSSIQDYLWNFGDGQQATNTSAIFNHTYNVAGDFAPTVTMRTTDGCSATFRFDSLHYGTPPTNTQIRASQTRFCASTQVSFFARATNANSYDWSFGNGNFVTTSDTTITHQFRALGIRNVTVTPRYNNCPALPSRVLVRVDGAISRFSYNNSCQEKNSFSFANNSLGTNLTSLWNFNDQNTRLAQTNATHTFPTNGNFEVSLIVRDSASGCLDTSTVKIFTATPTLRNTQNNICIHSNGNFSVANTYDNPLTNYQWSALGSNPVQTQDSSYSMIADSLGIFNSNMVVISNGNNYCNDTLLLDHPLLVRGPHAAFTAPTAICQSTALSLTNQTTHYPGINEPLIYSWKMGDNSAPVQATQPAPHRYQEDGNYTLTLIAKDLNGCTDSTQQQVIVRPMPFLWIIPRSKDICQGQSANLVGYTSDPILWNTSIQTNNFCLSCDSNFIRPEHTTTYYAEATNIYQCKTADSIRIRVMEPFTASIRPNQASICEQDTLHLQVYPSNKIITWSNPIGMDLQMPDQPLAHPTATTNYEVILKDSLNCFSSTANMHLQVNPKPQIELGDNKMLSWNTVYSLNPVYSNNVSTFLWSPADKLSCASCPNPQITVKNLEHVRVKVTSDSGCIRTDEIALAVECNNAYLLMPGAFTPDGDGLNDRYYPIARGMKYIKKFLIYNRSNQLMYQRQEFYPNDRQFGWDGRFKGAEQNPGTYVYVIEAVCEFGLTTYKSGSFVLVR